MTNDDEFKSAKDAGWKVDTQCTCPNNLIAAQNNLDFIAFTRPKQKPNAVVDFEQIDRIKKAILDTIGGVTPAIWCDWLDLTIKRVDNA